MLYKDSKLCMCIPEISKMTKYKSPTQMPVIRTGKNWLDSFIGNKNTGINEEINTGISILLSAGLANHDELPDEYKLIKPKLYNSNISGIINLTQFDNVGGTADIGIKYNDGTTKYYSVTQWKKQLSKCICNPSATKWYRLKKTDDYDNMNQVAYDMAVDYRVKQFGVNPNKKWKATPNCPGAKLMAEYLSDKASTSWNNMTVEEKINSMKNFLDIDARLNTNADGIIYWNNKLNHIEHVYKWKLNIKIEDYLDTYNNGIYIYHGKPDNYILKTQAKYNNGIIEGMSSKLTPDEWTIKKSSNYLSSWDVVAPDLNKIFKMEAIIL